jgi:hypothetical protein
MIYFFLTNQVKPVFSLILSLKWGRKEANIIIPITWLGRHSPLGLLTGHQTTEIYVQSSDRTLKPLSPVLSPLSNLGDLIWLGLHKSEDVLMQISTAQVKTTSLKVWISLYYFEELFYKWKKNLLKIYL